MTKENAIKDAKLQAAEHGCIIAIVNDEISTNSDDDFTGPYGYCPPSAVSTLHINEDARVEFMVYPNGDVKAVA
jgi:hypothetical protein